MNNTVESLALDASGNLYAGGAFTSTYGGGVSANRIAKWNGTAWSALGAGMNSDVAAIAVDGGGNVYAGGYFTTAGGISANYIAKWNGSSWSALSSGMNNYVCALALDAGGNLNAGGAFTTAGNTSASCIAKWNGSVWSAFGGGLNSPVSSLALDSNGGVYAAGSFTLAGDTSANHVAKWNGSAWLALGSGTDNVITAITLCGKNLYAGGLFTTAGGKASAYYARWSNSPPVNMVSPALGGTPLVGQQLTGNTGAWSDADGDTLTYTYQWVRADDATGTNTINIPTATASTYTLGFSDLGTYFAVRVTADDGATGQTSATSSYVAALNPLPVLDSINPAAVTVAGDSFTLTLNGSGFVTGSVVQWSGQADLTPVTNTGTQITVSVPASYVASVGTAIISVFNPAPGGGTSAAQTLAVVPLATVAISAPSVALTGSGPVTFTVMYSNAATVTLSANDIALNAVGSATGTVAVDGSGTDVRTVTLSNITGDGKLGITVAPGTALNAAGTSAAGASSAQFNVDNNPPSVQSVALLTPSPTRDATAVWRVTFSEPLRANTTAFVLTRVSGTVVGYTVASVSSSYGSVIDVTVKTGVGTGDLRLDVPAGIFKDAAGNAAPAFTTGDICTVDRIAPQAAATIVAPVGSGAASSPEFQWTPVDRATEYALRLQDITTTVTTVYNTTIPHADPWWQTNTNNRWPSNLALTDKHLYMAQITPSNEFGGAPISAAVIFGVGSAPTTAPAGAPTITQPSGNNVPLNNVDMLWTALPDASSYGVYVADTTTNTVIVNAFATSTAYRLPALQTSHSYAAYVRGINYFGSGPWSVNQAFACNAVTTPPATPPILTSPTANTLYPPTPATVHFEWANITNATTYSLLIINVTTNTNAFNGSVAAINGATTYTDIALSAGCNYMAYVKAGNAFGWTAYSAGVLFGTTGGATALPLAPSITRPANNGSVSYQNVQFQWSAQPGDAFYNVLIYNVTNNWALQVNQTPTTTTATYTLSPLCRYLVYVRANNAYGPGPYAAEYFSTLATAPQIVAPTITSATSVAATTGQSFSYTIVASGTAPITYTVTGLASGLTFDGASTISGVLTDSGTATITLKATNGAGSDTKTLTISVSPAASSAPVKPAPSPGGQF